MNTEVATKGEIVKTKYGFMDALFYELLEEQQEQNKQLMEQADRLIAEEQQANNDNVVDFPVAKNVDTLIQKCVKQVIKDYEEDGENMDFSIFICAEYAIWGALTALTAPVAAGLLIARKLH
jgi:uncharacterized lipoprotein YddW (UPF0748 family)